VLLVLTCLLYTTSSHLCLLTLLAIHFPPPPQQLLLQIRSVFRVIEGSQGDFGPLATNQAAFFLLDSLPLFIAVVIYIPFWPGQYINTNRLREEQHALKERPNAP